MEVLDTILVDNVVKRIKDSAAQSMIAELEEVSTTASYKHEVDTLFRFNGKLYKTKNLINVNDTIIFDGNNANCFEININDIILDTFNKADKVNNAINGNFASLDINGNLIDSGHKHSDYLTSFTETDPTVPSWAKENSKPSYTASEIGLGNVANERQYSENNPPPSDNTKQDKIIVSGLLKSDGNGNVSAAIAGTDYINSHQTIPVTDVQANNVSLLENGVANIPIAGNSLGIVKASSKNGIDVNNSGVLEIVPANLNQMKLGLDGKCPIVSANQSIAVFYGLAKAAKDVTQTTSNNEVGTYTNNAKASIRTMIGAGTYDKPANGIPASDIESGVIPDITGKTDKVNNAINGNFAALDAGGNLIDSGHKHSDYLTAHQTIPVTDIQIDGTSIINNGVANLNIAASGQFGVTSFGSQYGTSVALDGTAKIYKALDNDIKQGNHDYRPIVPENQHKSVFYGLAKAAGDTTQSESNNAVGTYTDGAKTAIRTMINAGTYNKPANGIPASDLASGVIPNITVTSITGGYQITITDADHPNGQTINIMNGTNGVDGISPTISTTSITGGHRITIVDSNGTQTFDIMDGTNSAGETAGADGYSPTASVSKSGSIATITITDKNGTTTAQISDGTNGSNGNDGTTFTPSVDSNGNLSWTNDGGKQNPSTVNIKGPAGDSGECVDVTISGSTPTIVAESNHRYLCGEVTSISFTPSATGICEILFTSGSTAAIFTLPATVKMPVWFDASTLDAETIYDISIADGIYGAVMTWPAI